MNTKKFAGFIDIHNHGAVGVDVNEADADGLRRISDFLATKGVTAWLPTLVPDSLEVYRRTIDAIDEVMATQDDETQKARARVIGVHYEGIFANVQMCGALRPQYFRTFETGAEFDELPRLAAKNAVYLTTLAPEISGGIELIKAMAAQNWIISIGHTKADAVTLDKAKKAGATHITHLFNAMTGAHHRDLGVAGWALTDDEMFCEVIADGIHVHPKMLELAYKIKTSEKLALVSDSVKMAGLGDGVYEMWNEKITVENGKTCNERGSIAGSVITLQDALRQMLAVGISLDEVCRMASLIPARILKIADAYGSLQDSKREDFIELDADRNVLKTVVGGRTAFELGK